MSIRFLLVDDSATTRKIVRRSLGQSGIEIGAVHEAADGADALSLLEGETVDVVITDLHMPNVDGLELLERLRRDARFTKLPVVVVSSDAGGERRDRLTSLGARFVAKPLRPEALALQLRALLEGCRS